jgi:hypothetical protein
MNYKGAYSGEASYSVGDVVVYTDNLPFCLQNPAVAGTTPHDKRYWARVERPMSDVVMMFHTMLTALTAAAATIPTNIDDEGIVLKSGDNEYLVSVDATGETPEVVAELIEEETAEGDDT